MTEPHGRIRRAAALTALAFSLGGCSILNRSPAPPREMYRLVVDQDSQDALADPNGFVSPLDGDLTIRAYTTPGLYGDRGVVYRIGDRQYGIYPSREWALPLGEMLGVLTETVMRRVPLVNGATTYGTPARFGNEYVWRAAVRQFEEVNRGREVFVAASFEVLLVQAQNDSVVWRGRASGELPVADGTMPAIVEALSNLSAELVARLVRDARRDLTAGAD